jgi:tape measure domain-containing protein
MTTERIDIQITETGARRVKGALAEIGQSARDATKPIFDLQRALKTLAAGAVLRFLLQQADAYTNLQNQLRLVTTSTAGLAVVTEDLLKVSNETRSSFEDTAKLYATVSKQSSALGLSQNETIAFTKSLNQAIILSGSDAQMASAGIRQLGQALGSGVLRGDELNSVLENTSEVAATIAKGMGVTIGQLRALGKEGQISAQDIIRSFQEASDDLNNRFGKTVPTVGQAVQVLQNQFMYFWGELDKTAGITATLAQGLLWLANNLDVVSRVAGAAAIVLGTVLARQAIGFLLARLQILSAWLLSNPWTAMLVALTAVIALLYTFSDEIDASADGMVKLADYGVATWNEIKKGLLLLYNFLGDVFKDFQTWAAETFGFMIDAGLSFPRAIARALDDLWRGFAGFFSGLGTMIAQAKANLSGYTGVSMGEAFAKGFHEGVMGVGDKGPVEGAMDYMINQARMVANSRIEREAAEAAAKAAARAAMDDDRIATVTVAPDKGPTFEELLAGMKQEGDLLRYNLETREQLANIMQFEHRLKRDLTTQEKFLVASLTEEIQAMQLRADVLEQMEGPSVEFLQKQQAIHDLMIEMPALTNQLTEALQELELQFLQTQQGGSFVDGYVRQIRIMQLETRNAVADMGAQFAGIFGPGGSLVRGLADATAQAIVFGDNFAQSMKRVAQSVVSEVISSLIQLGLNLALNAALGSSLAAGATAASVAQAVAVGSAWATPAALVNAATFGAGAAAGSIAVGSSIGVIKGMALAGGFQQGGYTGNGGIGQVAGVVHGQEYVMDAATTRRVGVRNLDRMRDGGMAWNQPKMEVNVTNRDVPGMEFEVHQDDERMEIIARRVLQKDGPTVIANDMSNPSSKTRKAVTGYTTATNKRS